MWIEVKDKLPIKEEHERYSHVIGVIDGQTTLNIIYDHEHNKFISNWDTTTMTALNLTHWMQIPKPPNTTKHCSYEGCKEKRQHEWCEYCKEHCNHKAYDDEDDE